MKQRIICKGLAVAVILLFIGVGIQPAIATVQTEKQKDIEGLVAQIKVLIDEILVKYGDIPIVANICSMISFILVYLFVRLALCIFLFILAIPVLFLYLIMLIKGEIKWHELLINLHVSFTELVGWCNPLYFPFHLFFSLTEKNDITKTFDGCPCLQE
jgi:hypothetical protein